MSVVLVTANAVEHVCARLSRRLGFRIHPHRFRHTFAVSMLRNGADIRTLQKLIGHASVQILLRYLTRTSTIQGGNTRPHVRQQSFSSEWLISATLVTDL